MLQSNLSRTWAEIKEDYTVFPWCIAPQYIIELVCDVITLKMDALSKQLHQALVSGEDTDVIHSHSCDLNTQFDFTVPSLQFVRLNVVFGHFIFVSSLVERPIIMLPANKRVWDKLDSRRFLFIVGYWESSKESSVFFLWAEESVSLWHCSSRNSILFSSRPSAWPVLKCNQDGDVLKNFEVYFFFTLVKKNYVFIRKFMCL